MRSFQLQDEKRVTVRMLPTSPSKKHSTPGDWYGCFAKSSYFSPQVKIEPRKKEALPNMKIKPNPLGGPGYADICLNPYPSYSHEPYDLRKSKYVCVTFTSQPIWSPFSSLSHNFLQIIRIARCSIIVENYIGHWDIF